MMEIDMSIFCCPKCGEELLKETNSYRCPKGHCYDRATGGYVNLLPTAGGKQHGDNREMLKARRVFLDGGSYGKLQEAVADTVKELLSGQNATVFDAGCGEGYYTEAICKALPRAVVYGVDVSKDAVKMCDKRRMHADFATASVYSLPVKEQSVDLILSVFSPFAGDEFHRILKKDGYLISVIPDAKHLWELKSVLYDTPYENKVDDYEIKNFSFLQAKKVAFTMHLQGSEEIGALYRMTPYCYRTGKAGAERMERLESLDCGAEFQILVYQKK